MPPAKAFATLHKTIEERGNNPAIKRSKGKKR